MNYTDLDQALAKGSQRFNASLAESYVANCASHPLHARMATIKNISMLGAETLLLMRAFAIEARGGIVEIGPYIGGSTIALMLGVEASSAKPIASIDPGGAYLNHPSVPSTDIHSDWRKNVSKYAPSGTATLIGGFAFEEHVATSAINALGGQKIGMLVIDADGRVWQNMKHFVPHLADDCLFVFDDYTNLTQSGDNVKFEMTRRSVDDAVDANVISRYGVFLWGTWFGRRGSNFSSRWLEFLDAEERRFNG